MAMTPELAAKISLWRMKALENTLTEAEMAQAVLELRAGRVGASVASETSRKKKAIVEIPSADALLDELGGL
jgi:hypothetical protein